ncbi:hypothetical protein ZIOFF_042728 [Zingiber officinale]|uniref:DDE Tnp4 domain-containing protein n=1 Tax=Zingiber officinale TaxID=94328 RepID=A0A8J5G9R1_ZINOF|nr:hypothetical protein ZIOFF_042728 [Zingiber officinale]
MNILQDGKKLTVEERNCLGAIDGTHVSTWAPTSIQTSFRDRKVIVTQNVMLACDFDILFTFAFTGWEGMANDSRVFIDTLTRHENNFPKPCSGDFNDQKPNPIDPSQIPQMGHALSFAVAILIRMRIQLRRLRAFYTEAPTYHWGTSSTEASSSYSEVRLI